MFLLNQDELGTSCDVNKHTKISVEICISADIQNDKYQPIISMRPIYQSVYNGKPISTYLKK